MKILYPSYTRLEYSLNSVCIKGLRENGVEVVEFRVVDRGFSGFVKVLSFCRKNLKYADAIIVGYDSPALVSFLNLFYNKKIIYNAVLSVHERLIIARELAPRFSLKAVYYWLLDFTAVHSADLIMLESDHQADYFNKIFKVSKKKLYRNWIGVDESKFYYDPTIKKPEVFTVLFRGALMPEAGIEYVIRAAKILEGQNVKFILMAGGLLLEKTKELIRDIGLANLEHLFEHMPYDKLREKMQACHLSLGQLSDHVRLDRTLPHKVYESLAMKLPYLTASNSGILELLTADKTCLTCSPADAESLADKILWAKNNYQFVEQIAENGYQLYKENLRSSTLSKNLLDKIQML